MELDDAQSGYDASWGLENEERRYWRGRCYLCRWCSIAVPQRYYAQQKLDEHLSNWRHLRRVGR
jgi:hypothetical protein